MPKTIRIRTHIGAGLVAVAMCAPIPSHAHVPPECRPLFIKAGEDIQKLIRKGQETSAMAMDGLDSGWQSRYPYGRYERLADLVAQLMGALTFNFQSLHEAIACVDSAAQGAQRQ